MCLFEYTRPHIQHSANMDLPPPPAATRDTPYDLDWAFDLKRVQGRSQFLSQDDFKRIESSSDFERRVAEKVRENAPVTDFHGKSLDMWRNDGRKPVLGEHYLKMYIRGADASGLGTRERTTASINLSQADRAQREKLNDIVPRAVLQLDNYLPGAHRFRYVTGDKALCMDVLQLNDGLRVTAEVIMEGSKGTITHSITGSTTEGMGDRTGCNYWKTVCMKVQPDGTIQWFGDALAGETFTAKLVDPRKSASTLITMLQKLVTHDS